MAQRAVVKRVDRPQTEPVGLNACHPASEQFELALLQTKPEKEKQTEQTERTQTDRRTRTRERQDLVIETRNGQPDRRYSRQIAREPRNHGRNPSMRWMCVS